MVVTFLYMYRCVTRRKKKWWTRPADRDSNRGPLNFLSGALSTELSGAAQVSLTFTLSFRASNSFSWSAHVCFSPCRVWACSSRVAFSSLSWDNCWLSCFIFLLHWSHWSFCELHRHVDWNKYFEYTYMIIFNKCTHKLLSYLKLDCSSLFWENLDTLNLSKCPQFKNMTS